MGGASSSKVVSSISREFGITIALLIPGFITLWPIQHFSDTVRLWFQGAGVLEGGGATQPAAAGFFLIVVASLALGMLVEAVRWAVMDRIHRWAVPQPRLDYSALEDKLAAYVRIVEAHYRYYQYYANTAVALALWLVGQLLAEVVAVDWRLSIWLAVFAAIQVVLFLAARDALTKTDQKLVGLLGELPSQEEQK